MASDLNRTLSDAFTGIALGATDQVTGKDNLGQFIASSRDRSERAKARESNAVLLAGALKTGRISKDFVPDQATFDSMVDQDAGTFAALMEQQRAATAESEGDAKAQEERDLALVRDNVVGSLAELEGLSREDKAALRSAHDIREEGKKRAVAFANDTVTNVDAAVQSAISDPTVDSLEQAEAQGAVALQDIEERRRDGFLTQGEADTSANSINISLGNLRLGKDTIRKKDILATLDTNVENGLVLMQDPDTSASVKAQVQESAVYQDRRNKGQSNLTAIKSLTPEELAELPADTRAIIAAVSGGEIADLDGSWDFIAAQKPSLAASLAGIDDVSLGREVNRAKAVVNKQRPAIAQFDADIGALTDTFKTIAFPQGVPTGADSVKLEPTADGSDFQVADSTTNVFADLLNRLDTPGAVANEDILTLYNSVFSGAGGSNPALNQLRPALEARAIEIEQEQLETIPDQMHNFREAMADTAEGGIRSALGPLTAGGATFDPATGSILESPLPLAGDIYVPELVALTRPDPGLREELRNKVTNLQATAPTDPVALVAHNNSLATASEQLREVDWRASVGPILEASIGGLGDDQDNTFAGAAAVLDSLLPVVKGPETDTEAPATTYQLNLAEAGTKSDGVRLMEVHRVFHMAAVDIATNLLPETGADGVAFVRRLIDEQFDMMQSDDIENTVADFSLGEARAFDTIGAKDWRGDWRDNARMLDVMRNRQ